jgi:hypothetical protein
VTWRPSRRANREGLLPLQAAVRAQFGRERTTAETAERGGQTERPTRTTANPPFLDNKRYGGTIVSKRPNVTTNLWRRHIYTTAAFKCIAELSSGVCVPFDTGSASELGRLLRAAAKFAAASTNKAKAMREAYRKHYDALVSAARAA